MHVLSHRHTHTLPHSYTSHKNASWQHFCMSCKCENTSSVSLLPSSPTLSDFMPAARNPVMLSVNTHTLKHIHTHTQTHTYRCVCPLTASFVEGDVLITEKLREFVLFTLLSRFSFSLAIVVIVVVVVVLVHCIACLDYNCMCVCTCVRVWVCVRILLLSVAFVAPLKVNSSLLPRHEMDFPPNRWQYHFEEKVLGCLEILEANWKTLLLKTLCTTD